MPEEDTKNRGEKKNVENLFCKDKKNAKRKVIEIIYRSFVSPSEKKAASDEGIKYRTRQ
jgi:hypothetical protein